MGSLLRGFFVQFINAVTYKWTYLAKLAAITLYDIIDIDLHSVGYTSVLQSKIKHSFTHVKVSHCNKCVTASLLNKHIYSALLDIESGLSV